MLRFHLDQFEHFDASWSKWIKPRDFVPEFKPAIGVFLKPGEIERLRTTAIDYYRGQAERLEKDYKHAQRHNMLCPTGTEERPAPPGRLPFDVKPTGSGDATEFHAAIDASPGWDKYYRSRGRGQKAR